MPIVFFCQPRNPDNKMASPYLEPRERICVAAHFANNTMEHMRHSFHYTSNAELSTQSERMSINLRCDLPHYSGRIYVHYKHSIHENAHMDAYVCVGYVCAECWREGCSGFT